MEKRYETRSDIVFKAGAKYTFVRFMEGTEQDPNGAFHFIDDEGKDLLIDPRYFEKFVPAEKA